jgi:hypothetical protein
MGAALLEWSPSRLWVSSLRCITPRPAGCTKIRFCLPPYGWIKVGVIWNALLIDQLPFEALQSQLDRLRDGFFGWSACEWRQVASHQRYHALLEGSRVALDLLRVILSQTDRETCDLLFQSRRVCCYFQSHRMPVTERWASWSWALAQEQPPLWVLDHLWQTLEGLDGPVQGSIPYAELARGFAQARTLAE